MNVIGVPAARLITSSGDCTGPVEVTLQVFSKLAKIVRSNRERIFATVKLNLSNSELEELNQKIRLINDSDYGHRLAQAVVAYLCFRSVTIELPT